MPQPPRRVRPGFLDGALSPTLSVGIELGTNVPFPQCVTPASERSSAENADGSAGVHATNSHGRDCRVNRASQVPSLSIPVDPGRTARLPRWWMSARRGDVWVRSSVIVKKVAKSNGNMPKHNKAARRRAALIIVVRNFCATRCCATSPGRRSAWRPVWRSSASPPALARVRVRARRRRVRQQQERAPGPEWLRA